jgi:hypothetical protein
MTPAEGTAVGCAQASDLPASGSPVAGGGEAAALDPSVLLGRWHATNPEARGVVEVEIAADDAGGLTFRAFGADPGGGAEPIDWGAVPALLHAAAVDSRAGTTVWARYRFDFMEVDFQAFAKLGVLVMASFTRFTDASGRAAYFAREFFHLRA